MRGISILPLVAVVAAIGYVVPADSPADTAPTPPATNVASQADDAATLIQRGKSALEARDYEVARSSFRDALKTAPTNVLALHGLGLAQLYLADSKEAAGTAARALELANSYAHGSDRAIVLNLAAACVREEAPVRAAMFLKKYLWAHAQDAGLDEPMLNALGATIQLSYRTATNKDQTRELTEFYMDYNAQVERLRPGLKRWGAEWMAATVVDQRKATWQSIDALEADVNSADTRLRAVSKAWADYANAAAQSTTLGQRRDPYSGQYYTQPSVSLEPSPEVGTARREFELARDKYVAAVKAAPPRAEWPAPGPVSMDDQSPPQIAPQGTVRQQPAQQPDARPGPAPSDPSVGEADSEVESSLGHGQLVTERVNAQGSVKTVRYWVGTGSGTTSYLYEIKYVDGAVEEFTKTEVDNRMGR